MNYIYFLFMETYKRALLSDILDSNETNYPQDIEEVESIIRHDPNYTINRNAEGKIHSRYLGNRYEPAIIQRIGLLDMVCHFYLFDGDIKDCDHPFSILYQNGKAKWVNYYSTRRIRNNEPIVLEAHYGYCLYNSYHGHSNEIICVLDEYDHYKQDYEVEDLTHFALHEEILVGYEEFVFKFAD